VNRIKKLLTWRSDNNIDNILNDPVIKKVLMDTSCFDRTMIPFQDDFSIERTK